MVCYDRTIFVNLESEGAKKFNNQKLSFYIFTVGNVRNIFMEHDLNI